MITVIQRVIHANVKTNDKILGAIQVGILALIGLEMADTQKQAERLLEKILNYRIFNDPAGKMNLSLKEVKGGLLLVPQFTLVADTQQGTRPGFSTAMEPSQGKVLFDYFVKNAQCCYKTVACGEFGADMQVSLCNDGPVTFLLKV